VDEGGGWGCVDEGGGAEREMAASSGVGTRGACWAIGIPHVTRRPRNMRWGEIHEKNKAFECAYVFLGKKNPQKKAEPNRAEVSTA
jgi:hypothetical protein